MQPTPSPSTSNSAPGTADLSWVGGLVEALSPALIALAGVIALFWLQQAASRRADRQKAQDQAFQTLAQTLQDFMRAARSGDSDSFKAASREFLVDLGRAFWFVDRKDDYVVAWVVDISDQMVSKILKETDFNQRESIIATAYKEIWMGLRVWRYSPHTADTFATLANKVSGRNKSDFATDVGGAAEEPPEADERHPLEEG